jgi:hypothetical protein
LSGINRRFNGKTGKLTVKLEPKQRASNHRAMVKRRRAQVY